jgi:hypothetical protein
VFDWFNSICIHFIRLCACVCVCVRARARGIMREMRRAVLERAAETNLDRVRGIPQAVHNVLHQAISFIRLKNVRPEESWLAEVVLVCRVVSASSTDSTGTFL